MRLPRLRVCREFPKIRSTFFWGVPKIRIIGYWGLYEGPLALGNYHVESSAGGSDALAMTGGYSVVWPRGAYGIPTAVDTKHPAWS